LKKKKKTLFWQINHPAMDAPSYLLGTMHIKPNKNSNWMQDYLENIIACDCFATEFNLSDVNIKLIQQYSQLPDGQSLDHHIAPKKLQKMERILLKSTQLPLQPLLHTKPLFIINLITEKILSKEQSISMDSELFLKAKELGKELDGIETFEEQLSILNKIPLKYQIKGLLKTVKNIKQSRKKLLKITSIYETGDVHKIHKVAKKGMGRMRQLMLYDRNKIMAQRIIEKTSKKTVFCAIGAGHLGGKKGVLRLLKSNGLSITPIFF
jgi:uncharacterized protein YbaP (TraB family)